jgi:prepilin-type N-terminal cleavage/methylation domain-containing protein
MKKQFKNKKSAFTLVEIMIVVAIIGLLMAIAIPSLIKARRGAQEVMIKNNMRVLRDTVEQLAFEQMVDPVYVPLSDIFAYIGEAPEGKPAYYCLPWPNGIWLLDMSTIGKPPIILYWSGSYKWYSTDNIPGGTFRQIYLGEDQ